MNPKIDRRQALGALGAVSLTGLLAACGGDDEETGTVTTTEGESSTVQKKSSTSRATTELFESPRAAGSRPS